MHKSIFKKGKRYTFRDYYEMSYPSEEILSALGYSLILEPIVLPTSQDVKDTSVEKLQRSYYELVSKVSLNSEIAKRELIIAPLLHEVIRYVDAKLHIEYSIDVSDRLSGTLDYLIRAKQEVVIIEAKKGDLERGFNQLAAELVALDQYRSEDEPDILYGVITIGEVWRFALLKRATKTLIRDVHTYRFPEDTREILAHIWGIINA